MTITTRPFDPAEYLDGPEAIADYMAEAFATGDPAFIQDSLGVVARSKGMSEVARKTGLGRESLYKALSPTGHPEFSTIMKVLTALDVTLAPGVISRSQSSSGTNAGVAQADHPGLDGRAFVDGISATLADVAAVKSLWPPKGETSDDSAPHERLRA